MKANINGVTIEGTPQEIHAFIYNNTHRTHTTTTTIKRPRRTQRSAREWQQRYAEAAVIYQEEPVSLSEALRRANDGKLAGGKNLAAFRRYLARHGIPHQSHQRGKARRTT